MVKKKLTKKTPENSNENKNVHCNNKFKTLVTVILSLLLINILLSLVILTSQSSSISNDTNSKLDSIDLKVNAIDNFFRTNVQGYDSGSNTNDVVGTQTTTNINISADDDPFLGNPKAKVTVIEFSDLQCPFCRKYWTESYPQLKGFIRLKNFFY